MASLTRTISIKLPTDPHALAALRALLGLSDSRRQRATPERRSQAPPRGWSIPFRGDVT